MNPLLSQYSRLLVCVIIPFLLWPLAGSSDAPAHGWKVFSVFIAVILSFILRPFPMGTMVILGLVILTTTNTITIQESLSGYGDSTVWLVVAAFRRRRHPHGLWPQNRFDAGQNVVVANSGMVVTSNVVGLSNSHCRP